ncbi:hypothetical protein GCM10007962_11630 [Yeosuana aromativorans]|uniref:Uncharacterized protein n=1 Tax=Yeosuana aromativorans TaxID=288019 RepID=A0A8J3BJG0_9FLAO|nr:hypothetical protein [Yeosuana aromativorans]GGK19106.1 hypothetical protein GCM10007962_11630 [Yeosuana aromativorans]
MNGNTKKEIDEIQNIIKPFETEFFYPKDEKALEADLNWNASIFLAKLLIKAKQSESDWSKKKLKFFVTDYNSKNNTSIDVNTLLNKYWIREILDLIHIPKAVRDVLYDFGKMQNHQLELNFVRTIYESYPDQKIDKEEYNLFLKKYKSKNKLTLDETWIKSTWIETKKENELNIKNIYYYFTLLDNWEDFRFLYILKEEKAKNDPRGLAISKKEFNDIHTAHKSYFFKSPTLNELKEQEIVYEKGDQYYINFYNSKVSYWSSLGDKISGFVWEELIPDKTIYNDKSRIKLFLSKVLYWEHHWPNFYNNISKQSEERFVKAAFELVLEEKDIVGVKDEFFKCYLDENLNHNLAFKSGKIPIEDNLESNEDYYEFYEDLHFLSDKHQGNLFYVQETRNQLAFLIKMIVCCDTAFSDVETDGAIKKQHYPLIKSLLENGLERPYLLWETSHFIIQNKPTIIPYLLEKPKFASLAFRLINAIKIESSIIQVNNDIKIKLYESSIKLSLNSLLYTPDYSNENIGVFVFQLFKEINRDKYKSLSNVRTKEEEYKIRQNKREKENLLLELIEDYPAYGYYVNTVEKELLFPKIITSLITLFEQHEEKIKYLNGTIQFPIIILDGLSWLSKCINYSKYEKQFSDIKELKELISSVFKDIYLEKIEQKSGAKKDIQSNELIDSLPSWSERNERVNQVDWVYLMVIMYDTNTLKHFLSPRFSLKKADHEYDEENRFNAKKIRTHLFVLLITLQKITLNRSDFFNVYDRIRPVKAQLEEQIVLILKDYAIAGKSSKIDILSSSFERQFSGITEEELLPQIAQAINWFEEKIKVIDVLINTSDLLRLLIILDWITSEGIKKQILEKVKDSQVLEYLQTQNWLPEIELTLTKLSHYKELVEQTETALSFWEKFNPPRENVKFEQASFIVKLVLAYNDKDIKQINSLKVPEQHNYHISGIKPFNYKQFFIGLIHFESNPESAYKIFDTLYIQFPEHSSICINRFASKINWATKTNDTSMKNRLFNEALQEWLDVEKLLPESSMESIMDKVWVNKLSIYYHLKDFEEFERLYVTLPTPYQMIGDIISLKIEILLLQGKQHDAIQQLHQAIEYHQLLDGSNPDFITKLKTKVDDKSDIKLLKANYLDIFSKKPKTLIQIFPEKLNGELEIGRFITKEFAIATNKLLDKIMSIDKIEDEDKYNDLIQVALESRFSVFEWTIKDQSRGGHSQSGKGLGERDILIQDYNNETISICEAFIYRDLPRTEAHINKLFNYTPSKNHLLVLIYELTPYNKFEDKWRKYFIQTLSKLKYSKGFEIDVSKSQDLTEEFDYKESAIKIGITKHGKSANIYHIMVNLKYKV